MTDKIIAAFEARNPDLTVLSYNDSDSTRILVMVQGPAIVVTPEKQAMIDANPWLADVVSDSLKTVEYTIARMDYNRYQRTEAWGVWNSENKIELDRFMVAY